MHSEMIDLSDLKISIFFWKEPAVWCWTGIIRLPMPVYHPEPMPAVLDDFCKKMGYTAVVFDAVDMNGLSIYHTNVMMCVGDRYVVICLDSIPNLSQKNTVRKRSGIPAKKSYPSLRIR